MQRVLIIGPCGAGKSTLAAELGSKLGMPIFHMDQLNWKPGWVESGDDEICKKLAAIVSTDRWLIDGSYAGTLGERLDRADIVVYLDYPIRLCLARLLRRIWRYRGSTRPDMTEGCPKRFDFGFLLYLLQWNSGPKLRMEAKLKGHEAKVVQLNSPEDLELWLDTLPPVA